MQDADRVAAGHHDDVIVLQVLDGVLEHLPGDHLAGREARLPVYLSKETVKTLPGSSEHYAECYHKECMCVGGEGYRPESRYSNIDKYRGEDTNSQ